MISEIVILCRLMICRRSLGIIIIIIIIILFLHQSHDWNDINTAISCL